MAVAGLDNQKAAVVGGGISGLLAAYEMVKSGYSGQNITVFEGANRFGGKIQSGALDGKVVNLGAEFIDSKESNPRLIAICEELGVKLIPATDQKTENFHISGIDKTFSGEAFHAAYKPIAEQIITDKNNLIENGRYTGRALQLENMSLSEYLEQLAANVQGGVDPRIIEAAARIYGSEAGNDPHKVSALQFVNEASGELGSFLNSDCGYRVEGGTEQLIHALKNYLQGAGVQFETDAKLAALGKENGKFSLQFEKQIPASAEKFDKVVLALPAKALGEIEGLEALGMQPQERELLKNTQYTHSSKFFVKLKDGVEVDNACFFSGDGFQCWSSEKGMMTFLAGGEKLNEKQGIELVDYCLGEYARAHGKKASDLFELAPDKVVLGSPDTRRPCYCSPGVGQAMKLGALFGAMERMAEQGVALVGTFFPRRDGNESSVGFMECGANAAKRAVGLISQPTLEKAQVMQIDNSREAANDMSWIQKTLASGGSRGAALGT